MKKLSVGIIFGFMILAFVIGCASVSNSPRYDQVLVYDRPYDYTYLRTLEALNMVTGWTIEETDKVKGLIVLRSTQYGHMFDRDKWVARFIVKSLGRKQTSIALEPSSQHLVEGGTLLRRIDEVMAMSQVVKGEKRAEIVS